MILSQIADQYPILKPQETLSRANKLFEQQQFNLLAIVEKNIFIAIITPKDLKNHFPEQKIAELIPELAKDAVLAENDLLSTIPLFEKYNSKILPVIDDQNRFIGYIEFESLGKEMIQSDFNQEEGGIIKIQFHKQRDSLSQIIRIMEENKALVIKSYIKDRQEENSLPSLVLQVKTEQLGSLVQHLERHGYFVEQSFQLIGSENFDHSRYDSLMKYLTI